MSKTPQPQSNPNTNPNFVVANPEFDKVVVLPTPKPINAGETIGLMGEYNVEGEENIKCLHLEVFANEDFKFFLQNAKRGDGNLPQSFSWAKRIEESSHDHISIFENLEVIFQNKPSEDLKMNEMFKELFDLIDKDIQGQPGYGSLEVQELKDATVNPIIKAITNKYIVKHSSEWDDKVNMVDVLLKIVDKIDRSEFENKDEYKEKLAKESLRISSLSFFTQCKNIDGFPSSDMVYVINPIGLINEFMNKKCFCLEQGIVSSSCNGGGVSINNEHYEKLSHELGVEKEVLQAVAEVESGSRGSFQRENPKHATILYERHYFRDFITKVSTINNANNTVTVRGVSTLNGEENSSEVTVSNSDYQINQKNIKRRVFHEASQYFSNKYPNLIGDRGNYGSYASQLNKLEEAKTLNESFAIQSCSWGKFQVMGSNYRLLYFTPQELEIAQNQCELQHLQLFKSYLNNVDIINDMKNKNWREIARKYNGPKYEENNYHIKMENNYKRLKGIR